MVITAPVVRITIRLPFAVSRSKLNVKAGDGIHGTGGPNHNQTAVRGQSIRQQAGVPSVSRLTVPVFLMEQCGVARLSAHRPVTIPFLVGPDGPTSVLYFEATKRVAQREGGVAVTGWLRRGRNGRGVPTDVKSRGLGGNGNPVPGLVPLATINIKGREFWFMEERGYEGFAFELMEMTSDGLKSVLNVVRAGC